LIDK
jgi:hypothetical protein